MHTTDIYNHKININCFISEENLNLESNNLSVYYFSNPMKFVHKIAVTQ